MRLYYKIRCLFGKPVCYRKFPDTGETDWWFAMCKSCDRQSEVHELGGPPPLDCELDDFDFEPEPGSFDK